MDIFTTQLTRVVPVPIRPKSLKVKALLKEAATGKLKDDPDHLENHEYYFISDDDKETQQQDLADPRKKTKQSKAVEEEQSDDSNPQSPPHLDIYV